MITLIKEEIVCLMKGLMSREYPIARCAEMINIIRVFDRAVEVVTKSFKLG